MLIGSALLVTSALGSQSRFGDWFYADVDFDRKGGEIGRAGRNEEKGPFTIMEWRARSKPVEALVRPIDLRVNDRIGIDLRCSPEQRGDWKLTPDSQLRNVLIKGRPTFMCGMALGAYGGVFPSRFAFIAIRPGTVRMGFAYESPGLRPSPTFALNIRVR